MYSYIQNLNDFLSNKLLLGIPQISLKAECMKNCVTLTTSLLLGIIMWPDGSAGQERCRSVKEEMQQQQAFKNYK